MDKPGDEPEKQAPSAPVAAKNPLQSLQDLQRALSDACALGYLDNTRAPQSQRGGRPRRTGFWVAERLCAPGAWTKRHERFLKIAYLAGFDHAVTTGRGVARRPRKGRMP
jgi:hypothetical protein